LTENRRKVLRQSFFRRPSR